MVSNVNYNASDNMYFGNSNISLDFAIKSLHTLVNNAFPYLFEMYVKNADAQ